MNPRRDIRPRALALALACVVLGGAALAWFGGGMESRMSDRSAHAKSMRQDEIDTRFKQAVVMLHAKQYEHALTALHRLLELAPAMPEVHVNMGFALLGLQRPAAARDFFAGAIDLRPTQANAYYGLAVSMDALGERPGALGAMRTYVHLSKPDDPWLPKARAALWEWQGLAAPAAR